MSEMTYWIGASCAVTLAVVENNYTILVPLAVGILPRALDSSKQLWKYFSKDNCKVDYNDDSKLQEEDKLDNARDVKKKVHFEIKSDDEIKVEQNDDQIEPQTPTASAPTEDNMEDTSIKEKEKNGEDSLVSTVNYTVKVMKVKGGTLIEQTNKKEEKCGDQDVPEPSKQGVEMSNIEEIKKNGEENQ